MKSLPVLVKEDKGFTLYVDGKPFIALGGEFHNSSASDPYYMESHVWSAVDKLGGNCYLAPVYWEKIEPQEGVYDFAPVMELLWQARKHGMRLGLLWFGMWKGPDSLYVPLWMKKKLTDADYQRDEQGKLIRQLSPFADWIVEADRKAYAALMEFLRDHDGEERTVILMQVENEPGTWFHTRDYSEKANAAFSAAVPQKIVDCYHVSGTWEEAFGEAAGEMFMCYEVSRVVNTVAQTGKDIYPLPTFTNCVPAMGFMHVAGGPDAKNANVWKTLAPAIDALTPNVYDPDFAGIVSGFDREDNPIMVPETGVNKDMVSKLLYTVGRGGLMFSPFGIEEIVGVPKDEYKVQLMIRPLPEGTMQGLAEAYAIIQELYRTILSAREEGRLHVVLQGPDEKSNMPVPGFGGMVQFKDGDMRVLELQKYRFMMKFGYTMDPDNAPLAAAILIEEGEGEFLFLGINICAVVEALDPADNVFVEDLREYVLRDGRLLEGRTLSGDERNTIAAGTAPTVLRLLLSVHR